MYIVACARCQRRLTEKLFTSYAEAAAVAHEIGYATDNWDELWCGDCARATNAERSPQWIECSASIASGAR